MPEKPKFTIDHDAPEPSLHENLAKPADPAAPEAGSYSTSKNDFGDVENAGVELALHIEASGFHPVILCGDPASGKTSLLLSLLATIKTEPDLRTGIALGDPILGLDTEYGRSSYENAEQFFGQKTQEFIEGIAPRKTVLRFPFFIPLKIMPLDKPEVNLAFMESDGEWYKPDRSSGRLFRPLKKQIEDFIATYQGPITFIYLLPYTQRTTQTLDAASKLNDAAKMQDSALAISGALQAYERIRIEKQDDRHLMLVTKWDAHEREGYSKSDILTETTDADVLDFVDENYSQALAAFFGVSLKKDQRLLKNYCSGLMNDAGVLVLRKSAEIRSQVVDYPIKLWRWLYKQGLSAQGLPEVDPFPAPPQPGPLESIFKQVFALIDRVLK